MTKNIKRTKRDQLTAPRVITCANCPGEITTADDLITVKVPEGGTKAAHRTCPTSPAEPHVDWQVVAVREPGIGAAPIDLNKGDRVRIVIEGTIADLEEGFIGPTPILACTTDEALRLPHWLLRASRIERLAPAQATAGTATVSVMEQALIDYVTARGIPMPVYTNGSKIIEEAAELQEAVRSGDAQAVKEEVADVVITAAVAARQFNTTVEEALAAKTSKDRGRGPKIEQAPIP